MSLNVLIVEDDPAVRVVLRSTLQQAKDEIGLGEIFEAENGKIGIEVLKKEKIDLMLVDIYMPVMDGMEMLDHIYDQPQLKDIPAIVVSTDNDEKRVDTIQRRGLGFVHKPLTHVLLIEQIKEKMKSQKTNE